MKVKSSFYIIFYYVYHHLKWDGVYKQEKEERGSRKRNEKFVDGDIISSSLHAIRRKNKTDKIIFSMNSKCFCVMDILAILFILLI